MQIYSILDFMGISSFFQRFFSHDYRIWTAMLVGGVIGVSIQIFSIIKNRGAKAELLEKGIYIKSNGKELAYAFADINHLWIQLTDHYTNGFKTHTTVSSSFETKDGQRINFDLNMFPKVSTFANALLDSYESLRTGEILEDFRR
jgi:hypothetical protein